MTIKFRNTIKNKLYPAAAIAVLLLAWQLFSMCGVIPSFMLPSPLDVAAAFITNFPDLLRNSGVTLAEAFAGLFIGIAVAFVLAVLMDMFDVIYKAAYPLLIISQTIPVVAIAPLLVLWLGYDMAPKIVLVLIVCFFPISVSLLDGFKSADADCVNMLRAMGAGRFQIFRHIKLPFALDGLFSGLKISVSYSVVGAVIAEWLGGNEGLGVYMTRVRKAYAFDKMFAVIFLIVIISLALMGLVTLIQKLTRPDLRAEKSL
ncbi:MAG TPA: ABC transporter permease [Ruminiclostridium sp.]|nr:ABC transporter permease [Ruminiclostridium sp.]